MVRAFFNNFSGLVLYCTYTLITRTLDLINPAVVDNEDYFILCSETNICWILISQTHSWMKNVSIIWCMYVCIFFLLAVQEHCHQAACVCVFSQNYIYAQMCFKNIHASSSVTLRQCPYEFCFFLSHFTL